MRMQVILDSSFARPGSAPIWGGKKGEFRDWTKLPSVLHIRSISLSQVKVVFLYSRYSTPGCSPQILKNKTLGDIKFLFSRRGLKYFSPLLSGILDVRVQPRSQGLSSCRGHVITFLRCCDLQNIDHVMPFGLFPPAAAKEKTASVK